MKILSISKYDIKGGAARAAYRLHQALIASGQNSFMKVRIQDSNDWRVLYKKNKLHKTISKVAHILKKLQKKNNNNIHSLNITPTNWSKWINSSDYDVVNLHWIAGEMLSIEDIGRIKKPIAWTFHDAWPLCGAEHYLETIGASPRCEVGYKKTNKPFGNSGLDIDRYIWHKKRNAWKQPMHIITPSHWLADLAKKSIIFKDKKISVIPNALNVNVFKPLDKTFCRTVFNLPLNKKIILSGALHIAKDNNKGYDLLLKTIAQFSSSVNPNEFAIVIFGQYKPKIMPKLPFKLHWAGRLNDDQTLSILYNAADVVIVPSRQENLPQTATEAQACGTPVLAFNVTGLPDAIEHKKTGYLAAPYDTQDMSDGLHWILANQERAEFLAKSARQRAVDLWSYENVAKRYLEIYNDVINTTNSG